MTAVEKRFSSQPDRAASAMVEEILRRRLNRLERLERSVLRGEKREALHDFRVASRRAEAALDLLISPRASSRIQRLRKRLARGRKSISTARNYEVVYDRAVQALAAGEEGSEAWTAIRDYFNKKRRLKRAKAVEKLQKLKLKQTYAGLRALLKSPISSAKAPHSNHPARHSGVASGSFKRAAAAELRKRWNEFEKSAASGDPLALHDLRLAVKRLRYLAEILQQFDVASSPQAVLLLRKLQQRLGSWHDQEVEERLLLKMLGHPKFLRQQLPLAQAIMAIAARDHDAKEREAMRGPRRATDGTLNRLRACVQRGLGSLKESALPR